MSRILFFVNILFSGFLLILALFYQFNIDWYPIFSVFSLVVPLLFLVNVFFFLFWMWRKSKKVFLPITALVLGYLCFGSFFMLFPGEKLSEPEDLEVITFNAWGFNKNGWINDPDLGDKIIEFIANEDPDILCVQEHSRIRRKQLKQFAYRSETPYATGRTVQAIFSKYPILNQGSLDLPNTTNNVIFADIRIKEDTIRVYNMHLQSFKIVPSRESFSEEQSGRNYKRLVRTFSKQLEQAKYFDAHRKSCPYPYIVCGDMNNTQFSNIYTKLRGDLQDTFLEKGSGFGKTYSLFGLPIRIDYVLPDDSFEVIAHKNYNIKLSDHYPVKATLRRKTNP